MYAESIREMRIKRGMSQQMLADELGVSAVAVSKWERGVTQQGIQAPKQMADIFGVTVDALIGHDHVENGDAGNMQIMARAFRQLTPDEQEKLIAVGRALFAHAFDEGGRR